MHNDINKMNFLQLKVLVGKQQDIIDRRGSTIKIQEDIIKDLRDRLMPKE